MKIRDLVKCANFTLSGRINVYADLYNYVHGVHPVYTGAFDQLPDDVADLEVNIFRLDEARYEYFTEINVLVK